MIPESLIKTKLLNTLDLSGFVMASPPVPSHTGSSFPSLYTFVMADAQLGSIAFLCQVYQTNAPVVGVVDVSSNNITIVDQCVSEMPSIKSLDLSSNPIQQLTTLPVGLLELRLSNCGLRALPGAVAALSWRKTYAPTEFVSPLVLLDLSDNPIDVPNGLVSVACIPVADGLWTCSDGEPYSVFVSLFKNLESLLMTNTSSESVPKQWLSSSLSSLLVKNSPSMDLTPAIDGNFLRPDFQSPEYFTGPSEQYQCASLSLSSSGSPMVLFDPAQYNFDYCRCMAGYFGAVPTRSQPNVSSCRSCNQITYGESGDGMICRENSVMSIQPGFFAQWFNFSVDSISQSRNSAAISMVLPCPNVAACAPKVPDCEYAARSGLLRCGEDAAAADEPWWMCAAGYFDRLCSQCEDGYYRSGPLGCVSCRSLFADMATTNWPLIPAAALVAVAVAVFVLLQGFGLVAVVAEAAVVGVLVLVAAGEGWLFTVMMLFVFLYTAVNASAANAVAKSLLFFVQTLSVLAPRTGQSYPVLYDALRVLDFHPVGVDCAPALRPLQQPEWRVGMTLLLPAVLVVLAAGVSLAAALVRRVPVMRRAISCWDALRAHVLAPRAAARTLTARFRRVSDVHRHLGIDERDGVEADLLDDDLEGDSAASPRSYARTFLESVLPQVVQAALFILYAMYFTVANAVLTVFASCDPYDANYMAPPY